MSKSETDKPVETPTKEELQRLLTAAEEGDLQVLPELRHLLDHSPELWDEYGNLALHAQYALVKLAAGPNLLLAESLVRKLVALKVEVAGPNPSPLERLLAEQIAACWVQTAYFDALLAQAKGVEPTKAEQLRRHQQGAHRRYLAAIKQLAIVRKLVASTPSAARQGREQPKDCPDRMRIRPSSLGSLQNGVGLN